MSKILFIYPKVGYMDAHRDKPAPPLSILCAVSLLRDNYETIILDQRFYKSDQEFYVRLNAILHENPLYVGFSVYTGRMIASALQISKYIKEHCKIPVVWGGVHPSLLPMQTLENKYIDYVIQGEGEQALLEFSDMLAVNGQDMPPVKGVWMKKENIITYGGDRDFIDLDTLPTVPYHLINLDDYIQYYNGEKYIYYQASRGCPRGCNYCYNVSFNKGKFRAKTAEKIISDIKILQDTYSFKGLFFVDDNIFVLGKRYIMFLAEELKKLGLSWYVQGSDVISLKEYTENDYQYLESCGLKRIAIGVEATTERMRLLIGKKGNLSDIEQVVSRLRETKILVWCTYIINFPEETIDDLKESIRFIFHLYSINKNVLNAPFFIYSLNPGTPLYENYKNILPGPQKLEEWSEVGWERKNTNIFVDYLKDASFFQSLFLSSMFNDRKIQVYSPNKLFIFLASCYRPVASWRLRNLFFRFNMELFIFKKLFPDVFV